MKGRQVAFWPPSYLMLKRPKLVMVKTQVLYEIFPFLKQAGTVIHFLNLKIVTKLLLWNRKKEVNS